MVCALFCFHLVLCGAERQNVPPGAVTFLQRFGGVLTANLHSHLLVIAGVVLDRTDQGLKVCFVKGEPPSEADVADVGQPHQSAGHPQAPPSGLPGSRI